MASSPSSVATSTMSDEVMSKSSNRGVPAVPILDIGGHGSITSDGGSFSDFDSDEYDSDFESSDYSSSATSNADVTSSAHVIDFKETTRLPVSGSHCVPHRLDQPQISSVSTQQSPPPSNPLPAITTKCERHCISDDEQGNNEKKEEEEEGDYKQTSRPDTVAELNTQQSRASGLLIRSEQQTPPVNPLVAMMQHYGSQECNESENDDTTEQPKQRCSQQRMSQSQSTPNSTALRPHLSPQSQAPKVMPTMQQQATQTPTAMPAGLQAILQQQQANRMASSAMTRQDPRANGACVSSPQCNMEEDSEDESSAYSSSYDSETGSYTDGEPKQKESQLSGSIAQAPRTIPAGMAAAMLQAQQPHDAAPAPRPASQQTTAGTIPPALAAMMNRQQQQQPIRAAQPVSSQASQQSSRTMPAGLAAMLQQQQQNTARSVPLSAAQSVPVSMAGGYSATQVNMEEDSEEDSDYSSSYDSETGSGSYSDEQAGVAPHPTGPMAQTPRAMPAGMGAMLQAQRQSAAPAPRPASQQNTAGTIPPALAAMMNRQQQPTRRAQPVSSQASQQSSRTMPAGLAAMLQQQQHTARSVPMPAAQSVPRSMAGGYSAAQATMEEESEEDSDYSSSYDSETGSGSYSDEQAGGAPHPTGPMAQTPRAMPAGMAAMLQAQQQSAAPAPHLATSGAVPPSLGAMMRPRQVSSDEIPRNSSRTLNSRAAESRLTMMHQADFEGSDDDSSSFYSNDSECEEDDDFDVNDDRFTPNRYLQQERPAANDPMSLQAMLQQYDDSESDDDMSSSDYSGMDSMYSSGSGSSSDFDEEYEELMAGMPIALGRQGGPVRAPNMPAPVASPAMPTRQAATPGFPQPPMSEGLDLSMLNSLRSELEKVGNMINKQGSKFLQRAHILASINMLAANLPACVVEHLGQEIRDQLARDDQDKVADGVDSTGDGMSVNVSEYSDDTSELSYGYMDDAYEGAGSIAGDSLLPSEMEYSRRKRSVRHIRSDTSSKKDSAPSSPRKTSMSLQDSMQVDGTKKTGNLDKFLGKRRGSIAQQAMYHCTTSSMVSDDEVLDVLPATAGYDGALMFVDISGFTKLSTVLDPEGLSKVINSYFQRIVDKVYDFQGDIQKFAGDALFAEWRVTAKCPLEECVVQAAACAASMIRDCADFPVLALVSAREVLGSNVTSLNVHCGLGVGRMTGLHVGDSKDRREYLYIGDAIDQATLACDAARLGEAMASQEFYDTLATICKRNSGEEANEDSRIIANRNVEVFNTSTIWDRTKNVRNAKSRGVTDQVDGLEADALIEYRRLMSLYVHPVVVSNDVAAVNNFATSKTVACSNERHREEAELRSVYVMFIALQLPVEIRGNSRDGEGIHLLNDTMNLVTKKLKHYCGHLRQFIVDDKGFVMIATFGLRGSTFPNMVAERALPATLLIYQSLGMELGISCKIGATFGDVYCGAVGGEKRHEYAVMGPSVNLAARLMASPDNPGILVDQKVRQLAKKSYSFSALAPIKAKGYSEPVAIFQPLSHTERTWGRLEPHFVGREQEVAKLIHMAEQTMRTPYPESKLVLINGKSGMGKTTLLTETIERISRQIGKTSEGLVIAKHVGLDSEMLIPFATFGNIFTKVLSTYADIDEEDDDDDDTSCTSEGSDRTKSCESTAATTVTVSSASSTMSASSIVDAISDLGKELGAPAAVVDHATRYILESGGEVGKRKGPAKRSIASFFSHAFLRCIEEVKLVIIAVDDIHRTDELSWSVLRKVLENAGNVMMIGTSSLEASSFRIANNFWEEIEEEFKPDGRFVELELGTLSEDDLAAMTTKKLGLGKNELSSDLLHEVVVQSGSMPQFASQILDSMRARRESGESGAVYEQKEKSLSEIILHRVDTFDLAVRSTLNIGAVLGDSFTLGEVVSVLMENKDAKEKDVRPQVADSLRIAVREGILMVDGEEAGLSTPTKFDENVDSTKFTFFQVVWRTTLLGLMLASRKRDVHRKTAQSMEATLVDDKSVEYRLKMHNHWFSSGSMNDTTRSALDVGKLLEKSPRLKESIRVYEETLGMFGWIQEELDDSGYGFSPELLEILPEEEVKNIVELSVALGRAQELAYEFQSGTSMYENALHVMRNAPSANNMRDRSVVFPAFVALSNSIAEGRIKQDVYCRYEQSMINCFIQETRIHGRLIHHVQALYLQMVLYSRTGHNDKAIAVQSVIREIYKPDVHSEGLRSYYGMDSGAISFSFCAHLHMAQGDRRQALRICRRVLREIVPAIKSDFDQSFFLVFPLLFVLKDAGFSSEARQVFETVVLTPLGDRCQAGKFPFLERSFEPLCMLLTLAGKADVSETTIHEYSKWCVDATNLLCGEKVNLCLGRLGRCGDSITSELCLQLAQRLPKGSVPRKNVITFGSMVASNAVTFNRKNGLKFALKKTQEILSQLKSLGRDIQRRSTIF